MGASYFCENKTFFLVSLNYLTVPCKIFNKEKLRLSFYEVRIILTFPQSVIRIQLFLMCWLHKRKLRIQDKCEIPFEGSQWVMKQWDCFFFLSFFFCGSRNWTQDSAFAWQASPSDLYPTQELSLFFLHSTLHALI